MLHNRNSPPLSVFFRSWKDALEQIHKFPGAQYRGFNTRGDAEDWLNGSTKPKGVTPQLVHLPSAPASSVQVPSTAPTSASAPNPNAKKSGDSMYTLQFDGGSRGNPGVAGSGAVLLDGFGNRVASVCHKLPNTATNNEAEWFALLGGVRMAQHLGVTRLRVQGDSKLVINQAQNAWAVKNDRLNGYKIEAEKLTGTQNLDSKSYRARMRGGLGHGAPFKGVFDEVEFAHIPRGQNTLADELSNVAMDGRHWPNIKRHDGTEEEEEEESLSHNCWDPVPPLQAISDDENDDSNYERTGKRFKR